MAIELAVGAPTAMLSDLCPLGGVELCFAHLLGGDHASYQAYYEGAHTSGRFVILDNGIMERGFAADIDELLRITAKLRPALVTPPEVLHNTAETLRLARSFIASLRHLDEPVDTKVLGAAHGSSFDEWRSCFESLLEMRDVRRIGIPYDIRFDVKSSTEHYTNALQRLVTRRIELCEWVALNYPSTPVHLFGLAHPSELVTARQHTFITSLDTSLPVMAASRGIRYSFEDFGPFEKHFLELDLEGDDTTVALARHNVSVITNCWLTSQGTSQ